MVKRQRQTMQWSKDKDKQYNGQQTKTNNTMVKRKDKQNNDQKTKKNMTIVLFVYVF
jgi:hypothetical protein